MLWEQTDYLFHSQSEGREVLGRGNVKRKSWTYVTFHLKLRERHRWPSELRNKERFSQASGSSYTWTSLGPDPLGNMTQKDWWTKGVARNCMRVVNQAYAWVHCSANWSWFSPIFRSGKADPLANIQHSLPAYSMQPTACSLFPSSPRISQLHLISWYYLSHDRVCHMHQGTRGGAAACLTDDSYPRGHTMHDLHPGIRGSQLCCLPQTIRIKPLEWDLQCHLHFLEEYFFDSMLLHRLFETDC